MCSSSLPLFSILSGPLSLPDLSITVSDIITVWIWQVPGPNKVRFFLWLDWHTMLKTSDFLASKGMPVDNFCTCTTNSIETVDHLFRFYKYAFGIRNEVLSVLPVFLSSFFSCYLKNGIEKFN